MYELICNLDLSLKYILYFFLNIASMEIYGLLNLLHGPTGNHSLPAAARGASGYFDADILVWRSLNLFTISSLA